MALLSCLLFRERGSSAPALSDRLSLCVERVESLCRHLASTAIACGQEVDVGDFVREQVNSGLMEVVHAWAEQTSFVELCQLTDVLEGSIVRCITRLEEACKDIRNAARVIGDQPLHDKMQTASELIRRSHRTQHTLPYQPCRTPRTARAHAAPQWPGWAWCLCGRDIVFAGSLYVS